jgi:Fic family protein
MLEGVEQTANETVQLVEAIYALMNKTKHELREKLPKMYSKDLVEILFMHPYTKIDFLVRGLGITRQTASKYLNELVELGIMNDIKIGKSKFFIHNELFEVLRKGI